ncbi:26 kDa secreted antigen [Toxocara canis]|nr:26 kDa secreted antigen [Toxocara canis]
MWFTSKVRLLTALLVFAGIAVREGQGQECADTAANCQAGAQCFVPATQRTCRRTCNVCDCRDYATNCASFAYLCGNATYEGALRTRCQVTCGFCSGCGLHSNGIVPKYMLLAPSRRLNVTFRNGAQVSCGNNLTIEQQEGDQPNVAWDNAAGALYTLIMMGPQITATGQVTNNIRVHWLVVNIQQNNIQGGRALADYERALPNPAAGLQPYVFVVYRQLANINAPNLADRENFDATSFVNTNNLGYPLAANFFRTRVG